MPSQDLMPSIEAPARDRLRLWAGDRSLHAMRDGETLIIESESAAERSVWRLQKLPSGVGLSTRESPADAHLLAAAEAAFGSDPAIESLALKLPGVVPERMLRSGAVCTDTSGVDIMQRAMLWQQPGIWTSQSTAPYPIQHVVTEGRRHPRRPPKVQGAVYRRYIPWLARTLSFRSLELERDLPVFHRWMNDPEVDRFWGERGDLARHRTYLEGVATDPHTTALVACLDNEPFGYFEVYWAKEDRIAPFCDALDHDRGWHALIGEAACRGKPFLTAWMPSISHYLFLDDCRTQRIVIEPRADNDKMIKSLGRCGYALVKECDFPHKRAMLGMLLRERFFGEAIWNPRADPTSARP